MSHEFKYKKGDKVIRDGDTSAIGGNFGEG